MSDFRDFDPKSDDIVDRQVVEHEEPTTQRSLARRIALQALYEIDSAGHPIGDVLSHLIAHSIENRKVKGYVTRLVKGILLKKEAIDQILQEYAPEWPIHQVAVVDRNILRIALYEIGIGEKTPIGVAIDEAIELAKLYGAENTPRFINGVLGSIADNLEAIRAILAPDHPEETTPVE